MEENYKEKVTSFEALFEAMNKCKRGVMWKTSVAHYALNGIEETLKLEQELKDGTYKARPPMTFKITSPKPRNIISISFRDRIYQRSLNDNVIYPAMTKQLIYDNGACQKNRGTDFTRNRLRCFLQKFYRHHGTNGYVLQCDIKGYYPSMRHDVAKRAFRKRLDDWTYGAVERILSEQYPGEVGFNPGSQIIQIAGISVLSDLDHMIKERFHIKYYLRYMDDFILIHPDPDYLKNCMAQIHEELSKIGFELNKKKTKIYPISSGILFLGFRSKLTKTGKVLMQLDPKNVKRERRKLKRLVKKCRRGEMPRGKVYECYEGWKANAKKGNSWKLIHRMDQYLQSQWRGKNERGKTVAKDHSRNAG